MSFLFPQVLWFYPIVAWAVYRYYVAAQMRFEKVRILLLNFALLLMLVSLAQPVKKSALDTVEIEGTEIVIALDLSASMRATDIAPNRLEAAKAKIKALIEASTHDRFAILGFTSSAIILSPMTDDKVLLNALFDRLNTDFIVSKATKMASVFDLAQKLSLIEHKQLVIFSDGGDETFSEEIAFAKTHNIHTYPVGMATAVGSSLKNEQGNTVLDAQENIVISALNGQLKTLANQTGGQYFERDFDVQALLDAIHTQATMVKSHAQQESQTPLFYLPLALALLLFIVAASSIVIKIVPVLVLFWVPQSGHAGVLDFYAISQMQRAYEAGSYETAHRYAQKIDAKSWQALWNQAALYYKIGEYDTARTLYERIQTTDPKRKAALYYNIGNCYAKLQLFKEARGAYQASLTLDFDRQTADNLAQIAFLSNKPEMSNSGGQNAKDGTKDTKAIQKGKKKEGGQGQGEHGQAESGAGSSKMNAKERKLTPSASKSVGLSSKQYQTINKGSYNEKNPW